jgi:hypothetical protein
LKSKALTRRVIRLKKVYNIPKTIFDKRKPGSGCEEIRKNMKAYTFKEGSSELASGRELTIAQFI